MSILNEVPSILLSVIALIDHAYISIISVFWDISANYGLNPNYAFLRVEFTTPSFESLFRIFSGFYAQIVGIAILISALVFLAENSFFDDTRARDYVLRIFISGALLIFSFDIMRAILAASGEFFSYIWNNSGVNWYSLSSIVNTNYTLTTGMNLTQGENDVVEFFLMSSLFVSIGSLFGVLMIREAILLTLIIVLPFLSLLFLIKKFDSYTMKFWSLFVQLSCLPFFMIIPLYLASIFPEDFPLQLSLILTATLIPVLFVTSSRIFSIGSLYSLLDSLNFQRSLDDLPLGSIDRLYTGTRTPENIRWPGTDSVDSMGNVEWSKIYSKDFEYSRYKGS